MGTLNQFIKFDAGDSVQIDFYLAKDGAALDLPSVDIEFLLGPNTLQCNTPTAATLWKRSTVGSTEIEKFSGGLARVKLLSADTSPLCGGYVWTCRVIDGTETKTAAAGSAKIAPTLGDPP